MFDLQLILGDDRAVYERLIANLPAGGNNLNRGIVVPAHTPDKAPSFIISNVYPNVLHTIDIIGEWNTAPRPKIFFVPTSTTYNIIIPLPYGPVSVIIQGSDERADFLLSVTNFATLFRAEAAELSEYSYLPLTQLQIAISNSLAYRLTLPMLTEATHVVPADLETLASLAYKLLVKSFLHKPGTFGAVDDILTALSASHPYFFKMENMEKLDAPLYRSEELFCGWEAHAWLPNREIERWKAFIQLLNNLPQLYNLTQITENEVHFVSGGKNRKHFFDFESVLANSVTTGVSLTECFLNLFTLSLAMEAEHWISFCQASYTLDQLITTPLTTDSDPIAVTNWQNLSLSGRFQQQYGISPEIHKWIYQSPLNGIVDGFNVFFSLNVMPYSIPAVKIFVDGLLQALYSDYRISTTGSIISSVHRLASPTETILMRVELPEPRPFKAPVFTSLEVRGDGPLQLMLTQVEDGLDNISVVMSNPPNVSLGSPENIAIHYITPRDPSTPVNQYGSIPLTVGISSYDLVFPVPAASINYQLFVNLSVDPMPIGGPSEVHQIHHLVGYHNQTGASILFSAPIVPDMILNWWLIESDALVLERGTIPLVAGMNQVPLLFNAGPYLDRLVLISQVWNTTLPFGTDPQFLYSSKKITSTGVFIQFSAAAGANYFLDYAIFPAFVGNFVEFYDPPIGLIEAHYDITWPHWVNAGLLEPTDGVRKEFTLPEPIVDPKSLYLTLSGKLISQGNAYDYTVINSNKIRFNYAPTPEQTAWAVYPISDMGDILESVWDQGHLSRLPISNGEYSTGAIIIPAKITPTETIQIGNIIFEAKRSAFGIIRHASIILVGEILDFTTHGVQLEAVLTPMISGFAQGSGTKTITLAAGVNKTDPTYFNGKQISITRGEGLGTNEVSSAGNNWNNTTKVLTVVNDWTLGNEPDPTSFYEILGNEDQFPVNVSLDADSQSLTDTINDHPILSLLYLASYQGSGVILLQGKGFGDGSYNDTIQIGIDSSLIVGDSAPPSFQIHQTHSPSKVLSVTCTDIDLLNSKFPFYNNPLFNELGVKIEAGYVSTLPSPLVAGTVYYIVNSTTSDFQISLTRGGSPITLSTSGLGYLSFKTQDLEIETSTISIKDHKYINNEAISFSSELLPTGISLGAKYFVANRTPNTFKIVSDIGGTPIVFGYSSADFTVSSVNYFPAGLDQSLDTLSLRTAIENNPVTEENFKIQSVDGLITLTAKTLGFEGNEWISVQGSSMSGTNIWTGQDPIDTPVYHSRNTTYYYDAPVVALDGLNTRLWKEFYGEQFVFTYPPTLKQEAYIISEVYPLDEHPLDSMVANEPCNYPNGLFTQGAFTNLLETEIDIVYDASVVITTANFPIQEEPSGIIDGINTEFHTSLPSCSGQNSMILWIDGVFQPPTKWTYTDMVTYGKIEFLAGNQPVPPQKLWVWYINTSAAAIDERVIEPVGAIDGSNQNFGIPNTIQNAACLVLFLEGLFQLQGQDYLVGTGLDQFDYLGSLAPQVGQSLWSHYNIGSIIVDRWRQVRIGTTDGSISYVIPNILTTDLPATVESVLVFLDGLCQRVRVDYNVQVDIDGNPNGTLTFLGGAPEIGRVLDVAFIRGGVF
jgi:hypothetical protein